MSMMCCSRAVCSVVACYELWVFLSILYIIKNQSLFIHIYIIYIIYLYLLNIYKVLPTQTHAVVAMHRTETETEREHHYQSAQIAKRRAYRCI